MRRVLTGIVLLALLGWPAVRSGTPVLAAQGAPQAAGGGTWSEKARLLDLRSEVASAFVNGKVYIIGGLARNQEASALNQEYDPASDIWRERRSMPQPLSHPNATVLNGKIYVVGGFMAQVHVGAQNAAFEYDPVAETLKLIYVSPTANDVDNPDNITVTPRGGLLLCEDAAGDQFVGERLVGLTLDGNTFTFAQNNVTLRGERNGLTGDFTHSEWAGPCYSPDGRWLFANIFEPGITVAITGPWQSGGL
jgi:hypothetical protein